MAFFNPLGAFTAFAGGIPKGISDQQDAQTKAYDLMGMQALGRAFQPVQGPIAPISPLGPQSQPPMPGQASQPSQPPMGPPPGPQAGAGGPSAAPPAAGPPQPAAGPMPPQMPPQGGGGMPGGGPGGPPGMPPQQQGPGGLPQLDLQTLIARINKANPNLPPQAMVSALTRAVPLLNTQGKQELAQMRMQMQQEGLQMRREALELRERVDSRKDQKQSQDETNASEIGDAVIKGDQPPTLQGLYRMAAPVKEYLAKQGFNQSKAILEYNAAQKQIQALNGPQMTRYAGLAKSVVNTIDEVKALAEEMENSGIPLANRAKMAIYAQTQGNTPKGQLVARYMAGVNTLKEEFANLAQGGYAPTESAWKLADQQINGDYGVKQLNSSLDEVQRLINYRLQGIPNFQTLGPGAGNRYTGGGQQQQGGIVPGGGQIIGGGGGGGGAPPQQGGPPSFNDRFQGGPPPVNLGGGWSAQRVQ